MPLRFCRKREIHRRDRREHREKQGKIDKSLRVLRVLSNDFVPKITGEFCVLLQDQAVFAER